MNVQTAVIFGRMAAEFTIYGRTGSLFSIVARPVPVRKFVKEKDIIPVSESKLQCTAVKAVHHRSAWRCGLDISQCTLETFDSPEIPSVIHKCIILPVGGAECSAVEIFSGSSVQEIESGRKILRRCHGHTGRNAEVHPSASRPRVFTLRVISCLI